MTKQLLREQFDRWNGTGGSWAQGYRAGNVVFLQGQTGLTLDGYTYSQPAVARLLTRLAVIPDLVNVQLQQSTATKIGSTPVVHFTIAADVRKPGGGS